MLGLSFSDTKGMSPPISLGHFTTNNSGHPSNNSGHFPNNSRHFPNYSKYLHSDGSGIT